LRIPLFAKKGPTAVDPVCNMDVDMEKPGGGTFDHEGTAYYFCGPGCNKAFEKDPQAYLSGEKSMQM
jgi:YHS domain-containing protein